MRRFAEAENAWVVVAEAEGALAGFCIVHMEQAESLDVGYVVTIDVAAGFRRRGLGEQMLLQARRGCGPSGGAGMMLACVRKERRSSAVLRAARIQACRRPARVLWAGNRRGDVLERVLLIRNVLGYVSDETKVTSCRRRLPCGGSARLRRGAFLRSARSRGRGGRRGRGWSRHRRRELRARARRRRGGRST